MSNTFIQEAFQNAYLVEDAEEFSLNVSGPSDVESFLDIIDGTEDEVISDIYDLEAEAKEELKQSYIDKVILDCNVCHSNVFFDKDQITEDEEGLCCVDIECPYCMSNEGYTIIGEVKPYGELEEEPIEEVEEEVEDNLEEEYLKSSDKLAASKKLKEGVNKSVKGKRRINESDDMTRFNHGATSGFEADVLADVVEILDNNFGEEAWDEFTYSELVEVYKDGKVIHKVKIVDGRVFEESLKGKRNIEVDEVEKPDVTESVQMKEDWEWDPTPEQEEVYNTALEELNVWAENSTQGGQGVIEFFDNDTDKLKYEVSFADEIELMDSEPSVEEVVTFIKSSAVNSEDEIEESVISDEDELELEEGVVDSLKDAGKTAISAGLDSLSQDLQEQQGKVDNREFKIYSDKDGEICAVTGESEAKKTIAEFKRQDKKDPERKGAKISYSYKLKESLDESIEDVSITTDDETMTMTTKEDGGVVIETSPIPEVAVEDEVLDDAEMIAPLEPETEAEIEEVVDEVPMEDEMIIEEPGEDEFEEFDEESFNQLGESYLKRCYENVTSFKTSNITINESKEFIIEGKIGFDSGNEKDTQFIFTSKTDENGKLKLEGYNKQISTGKKTFKLNCSVNDKALVCESLNYNYKSKNDLNESVRVYGTVKRK